MADRYVVSGIDSRGQSVTTEVVAADRPSARAAGERMGLSFVVAYAAFPARSVPAAMKQDRATPGRRAGTDRAGGSPA
ncbi:MAG: hypothetical protein IT437_08230 [Phycisphaerales bacterium]|nr:hypothetical protein [Phycisphaerales bacterium]